MPELPEVETIVRTLSPQILSREIRSITLLHPKSVEYDGTFEELAGSRIIRLYRRAKLVLMELTTQDRAEGRLPCPTTVLAFHLKMTGSFFVYPAGTPPQKRTRIMFDLGPKTDGTNEGERLFFDDTRGFGYCRAMRPTELSQWSFWKTLGPEPLELSAKALSAHLGTRFTRSRRAIKAALLDQTALAGIGNIYADEGLFRAGIRPEHPAGELHPQQLEALAESLQAVLRQSIEECGSSIRDYRDALGNAGAFQNSFAVYGRKGELCRVCSSPLTSCRVAGRGTVYCPKCQR